MQLLMDFAGPSSEVRVERISRESLRDGGALAEVVDFYRAKEDAENGDSATTEDERIDEGLEVAYLTLVIVLFLLIVCPSSLVLFVKVHSRTSVKREVFVCRL